MRLLLPEIESLLERTDHWNDLTRTPLYFLARVREKRARPFLVAIYDAGVLAGVVYGVKHCVMGVPVGLIECGDSSGDGSVLASKSCFNDILGAAVQAILQNNFVLIARISWNAQDASDVKKELSLSQYSNWKITQLPAFHVWKLLRLDVTYERFLERLGSQTRRNMRYYRRRGEREGWVFIKELGYRESSTAIEAIFPLQDAARKNQAGLNRYRELLSDVPGSFFSALRASNGDWISVIGGWVRGASMFILVQLNNACYARASVSSVLRGYVIEHAIASGLQDITFIDGCEGILKKYTNAQSTNLLAQRDDWFSRFVGKSICLLFPSSTFSRLLTLSGTPQPLL